MYHPTLGAWMTPDPLDYVDGGNRQQYEKGNPISNLDPSGTTTREREGWTAMRDFLCGYINHKTNYYDASGQEAYNVLDLQNVISKTDAYTAMQWLDTLIKYNSWQEYDWNTSGQTKQQMWNYRKEMGERRSLEWLGININIFSGFHVIGLPIQPDDSIEGALSSIGVKHVDIYYNGYQVRQGIGGASANKGLDLSSPKAYKYWFTKFGKDYPLTRMTDSNYNELQMGSGKGKHSTNATDQEILEVINGWPNSGQGSQVADNCQLDVYYAMWAAGLTGFHPLNPYDPGLSNQPNNLRTYNAVHR